MTEVLDDLAVSIVDCEHKTAPAGDGFALSVGTKAMKDGRLVVDACKPVNEATYEAWTRRLTPEPGDLVLAREAPVGQVIRVPSAPRICLGQRTVLIRPDPSKVNPLFLHYWLLGPDAQQTMLSQAAGATVPHLNVADIRNLDVTEMPSDPKTQAFAADALAALDDLIENNRRRVEVLEEMAREIYREWFVHFRFPGHEDATFVDSDLGPIPEGWSWVPFTDVASFMNGFAFKPAHLGEQGRAVIKIKQLKEGVTKDTPRADADGINQKYWIEPGDLLMSWSAHLGVYWWMDGPGLLNQHLFKVTSISDYSTLYLFYALDRAMAQFWDRAQGTTMRHIKRAALTEVHALAPSVRIVELFTTAVSPLVESMAALKASATELAAIRDLLLPKLVTGQIDVSEVDLDPGEEEDL